MNVDDELAIANAATPGPWLPGGPLQFDHGDIVATDGTPIPVDNDDAFEAWHRDHFNGTVAETHNYFPWSDMQHDANQLAIIQARTGYPLALAVVRAALEWKRLDDLFAKGANVRPSVALDGVREALDAWTAAS